MSIGLKEPTVIVHGGEMCKEESDQYVIMLKDKYKDRIIREIHITIDGDSLDIKTVFDDTQPFARIRRITGYLVGTLDRFNNGKKAEESQRVKHSVPKEE